MSNFINNKLLLLVILSILLSHASAAYPAQPTDPQNDGTCASGNLFDTYDSAIGTTVQKKCIQKADQVKDCLRYKTDDGTCFCEAVANSKWVPIEITTTTDGMKYGCVPKSQSRINGICQYKSAKLYDCKCSDSTYKLEVAMDTTDANNENKIANGCAGQKIQYCKSWKMNTATSAPGLDLVNPNDDVDDGYVVVCSKCLGGATELASTAVSYSVTQASGIGCLIAGTYSCSLVAFSATGWSCSCGTNTQVTFKTSISQKVAQGCIATAQVVSDCSTYNYNSDPTKVTCSACTTSTNKLITILSQDGTNVTVCSSAILPTNCTAYYSSTTTAASIDGATTPECYACQSGYDKIPTSGGLTIVGSTVTSTGVCAPAGRWIIEQASVCRDYIIDGDLKTITDTYLQCGNCVDTDSNSPPCYKGNPKSTSPKTCTGGQLAVYNITTSATGCISDGIIDNCNVYLSFSGTTGMGCKQCKTGYTLVDTEFSTGDSTKKICIINSKVDANCEAYYNYDLSCYKCNNSLTYNATLKRCSVPLDAAAGCATAISSGSKTLCTSCLTGYTMVYPSGGLGVCVSSVEKCALFGSSGCTLCVSGYQLVSNVCTKIPENCNSLSAYGTCIQCKLGFAPNTEGQCIRTDQNTCPSGQVPSNGACVPVAVPIANCIRYALNSKCAQCTQGKNPSTDGLSCIDPNNPLTRPCPQSNTSTTVYRRNPSNPSGACVAVDAKCAISRDDGFCIACQNNDYAHSDGKCYKVVISDDGN